jgi:hypothetical protein
LNAPDHDLRAGTDIVGSADGVVIDGSERWVNIARHVVAELEPTPAWIDLRPDVPGDRTQGAAVDVTGPDAGTPR